MHTITNCHRCNRDFMYHSTDTHLFRNMNDEIKLLYPVQDETWSSRRWSTDLKESCDLSGDSGTTVICQDCHEIENIAFYIQEKADSKGWENAEYMAIDKFGADKVKQALLVIDKFSNNLEL